MEQHNSSGGVKKREIFGSGRVGSGQPKLPRFFTQPLLITPFTIALCFTY